ncbi:hypothetical protein [Archangium primigenium]|uniref:hypothetical protein n=1 Tax=[Archangium] primigenium TaxID=2792470 RepID=UPI0019568DC5|nr:hypothetical protein [Archangium primigenium]MBM7114905.1 hypothetical protein [Archangium primigenium]
MPQVFTVFNHGTDFHRDRDDQEVVTLLHKAVRGTEARITSGPPTKDNPSGFALADRGPSFLICEGPGSDAVSAEAAQDGVAHAHPGLHNPLLNTAKDLKSNPFIHQDKYKSLKKNEKAFAREFAGQTDQPWQTTGRALGSGWDDNVYRLAWLLTHLNFEHRQDIQTVNLVGWSRGAVTCIKQANKLHEVFGLDLRVNIFAIDPVPGGLTSVTEDIKRVPPNVKNLLVVLALDDTRSNFQPIDSRTLKVMGPPSGSDYPPNVHFLPLPGNHSDVVSTRRGNAPLSGQMCLHLAHKFLSHHGTAFDRTPPGAHMSVQEILDAYDSLRERRDAIQKAAASSFGLVGGRSKERHVREARTAFVSDPSWWINEHHRMCALSPGLDVGAPRIKVPSGKDYTPWQALLPQLGITYPAELTPRVMPRV